MKNQSQSMFFKLTSLLSPIAAKQDVSPEKYDKIFRSLYDLLPDHEHPKTWANLLRGVQDDNERQVFSAYEWHSVKIIIAHIKPPAKECRVLDTPPPGKNNTAIVADHFQEFVRKYNELGRDKKIDAAAVKSLLAEFKAVLKDAAKTHEHKPRMK